MILLNMTSYISKCIKLMGTLHTPTIVVQGGLGNQLFQWSFAHSISGNKRFFIDPLYNFSEILARNFELEEAFRSCNHIKKDKFGKFSVSRAKIIFRFLDRMWEFRFMRLIVEILGYFREDPRIDQEQSSKMPRRILYAKGYFQRQKDVENVFDAVQKEIIPLLDKKLSSVKKKFDLDSQYSVVHVRRGDYVADKFTPIIIGTLSDEYFIRWIKKNNSRKLILLTENREDVVDLLSEIDPFLILDKSDTTPWETLAIMYGASQLLGSNSSLSWWGARLCSVNSGEVWLPSQWSYWKNIEVAEYHFPNCHIAEAYWSETNEDI